MPIIRKLATLATAAEAARRYAKSNPTQAGKYVDQAVAFVDKQTKGKYSSQIKGVASKVKGVAGIPETVLADPSGNGVHISGPGYPSPAPRPAGQLIPPSDTRPST